MTWRSSRVLEVANLVLVVLFCIGAVLWAAGWIQFPATMGRPARILVAAISTSVAVADILYWLQRRYARYETSIGAKTRSGLVSISVWAIEESLARTAKALPEVHDARVRVLKERARNTPVHVLVRYAAWEDTLVAEITDKLRQVLQMRWEQIVGVEMVPTFEMYLTRIDMKELRKVATPRKAREEEAADVFRGPVYPTGNDF